LLEFDALLNRIEIISDKGMQEDYEAGIDEFSV